MEPVYFGCSLVELLITPTTAVKVENSFPFRKHTLCFSARTRNRASSYLVTENKPLTYGVMSLVVLDFSVQRAIVYYCNCPKNLLEGVKRDLAMTFPFFSFLRTQLHLSPPMTDVLLPL
jgi:hypothetical protein